MFTTQRLRFRAYQSTDAENLFSLYNDPRVVTYITEDFVVPKGPNHMDKVLAIVHNSLLFFIVETKEENDFVGYSGIMPMSDWKNRNGTFSIALTPWQWKHGYGMEIGNFVVDYAFRCLALHRVSLTVFEGNDRAMALYRKIGFVEEGRHRKIVWIDGHWRDTFFMGILEDEWKLIKSRTQESESEVPAVV